MAAPGANQTKSQYQKALRLQMSGDLDGAEALYQTLLLAVPKLAEVHFQLGRIAQARGAHPLALKRLAQARDCKPQEPAIWLQMAEVLAQLEDRAQSRRFLSEAKKARLDKALLLRLQDRLTTANASKRPDIGAADPKEIAQIVRLLQSGQGAQAERRASALVARHPDLAFGAHLLGSAQLAQGKGAAARDTLRRAVRLDPAAVDSRTMLGQLLLKSGDAAGAVEQFQAAVKLAPNSAAAHAQLGLALGARGAPRPAVIALRRALDLSPDQPGDIKLALARQLLAAKDASAAVDVAAGCVNAGDRRAPTLVLLAQARAQAGDQDGARADFDRAVAQHPGSAFAQGARALFLQSVGDFDAAESGFRAAIDIEPDNGEHYRTMGATYRFGADDPLLAQMQRYFDAPETSDASRMQFGFALARAMEQAKAYDRVFTYLRPANDLQAKRRPFDIGERIAEVDGMLDALRGADFTPPPEARETDAAPIYVTGMPRSGTTLVEQILSSHSQVAGAGEVGFAVPLISGHMARPQGGFRPYGALSGQEIADFGHQIAAHYQKLFPGTARITDKSIQSYMVMGILKAALPRARIVLVQRDPRDTLFSIYKNMFEDGTHRYSNNLRDLGLYYRLFQKVIAFWREALPGGFHEVRYEDLIAAPEEQARALLAACDLSWEDQCLAFHENKRQVQTLSVHQVRQPIYASSLKAWQRHEAELAEMIDALGDAV